MIDNIDFESLEINRTLYQVSNGSSDFVRFGIKSLINGMVNNFGLDPSYVEEDPSPYKIFKYVDEIFTDFDDFIQKCNGKYGIDINTEFELKTYGENKAIILRTAYIVMINGVDKMLVRNYDFCELPIVKPKKRTRKKKKKKRSKKK
jgi:hypothetical protein